MVFTNEAKKKARSAVGENVGASSYRSPASSVVIDPRSLCLCYSDGRHRDILGRQNGSRETPLSDEKNASKKYRSPVTSKRDSCATVIIRRQWTLCMDACTHIRATWGCPRHNAESHPLLPDWASQKSISVYDRLSGNRSATDSLSRFFIAFNFNSQVFKYRTSNLIFLKTEITKRNWKLRYLWLRFHVLCKALNDMEKLCEVLRVIST